MRRRPAHRIDLSAAEQAYLEGLVRDGHTEQRIARRARILLAMAKPETVVQQLAHHLEVDRTTIWYVCRRYEEVGVQAVQDAPRTGRPWAISPSAAGGDGTVGVL